MIRTKKKVSPDARGTLEKQQTGNDDTSFSDMKDENALAAIKATRRLGNWVLLQGIQSLCSFTLVYGIPFDIPKIQSKANYTSTPQICKRP